MTKFLKFLNENTSAETVIKTIEKECSQFLKEIDYRNFFYRGYKNTASFIKKTPRTDRRPLTTPIVWHDAFNYALKKKVGWKVRSEGVFASQSINEVIIYGEIYLFFPSNGYRYTYNPTLVDLTQELEDNDIISITSDLKSKLYITPDEEKGEDFINTYITNGDWKTNNLIGSDNNEVIFKCKHFYLVSLSKVLDSRILMTDFKYKYRQKVDWDWMKEKIRTSEHFK